MAKIFNKETESKALKSGLVVALGAGAVLAGQAVQSQNTETAHAAKKSSGSKSSGSKSSSSKSSSSKGPSYSHAYDKHPQKNPGGSHQVDMNHKHKVTSTTDRKTDSKGNTVSTATNKNKERGHLNNGTNKESWISHYTDGSKVSNHNWDKSKKGTGGGHAASFTDANGKKYSFTNAEKAGTVKDSAGKYWKYDKKAGHMQQVPAPKKTTSTPSTPASSTPASSTPTSSFSNGGSGNWDPTPTPATHTNTGTPSTPTPATHTDTQDKKQPQQNNNTKTPTPAKTTPGTTTPQKQTGKQTFNFIEKSTGKNVGTSNVSGEVGKDVPVSLKVPAGYKLVEGQKVPTSANIKSKDTPINILVEKDSNPNRQDGKQTIEFVDKDTGKVVSTPVVLNGKVGDKLTPDLKVPDGYKLAPGEKLPSSVDIKSSDTPIKIKVTKDGDNKKQDGQQTYRYIYNGKPIGTAVVKGKVGDKVPVSLKIPKGYKLAPGQKLPTEADIKASDKPIDIKLVKDNGNDDGAKSADAGLNKNNGNKGNGNNGAGNGNGNNAGSGNAGNGGNGGSGNADAAQLPQTGNGKSTAGELAGASMLATMASLGIAYSVKKRKA